MRNVQAQIWLCWFIPPLVSQRDGREASRHHCVSHELLAPLPMYLLQCKKTEQADDPFGGGLQIGMYCKETRFIKYFQTEIAEYSAKLFCYIQKQGGII